MTKLEPGLFGLDFFHMKSVLKTLEEDATFVRLKGDPMKLPSKQKKVIGFGRSYKYLYHDLSRLGLICNGKYVY